jgi:predicted amidohydrolase
MTRILAAVGQLCSTANIARNTRLCTSIIRRAAAAQAQLVYLPEASDFIAEKPADVPGLAEPIEGGSFVEALKKQARESKVWVGVGVHEKGPENEPEKCYNTQLVRLFEFPPPLFFLQMS